MNDIDKFESMVVRIPESGCWIFMGSDTNQYGHVRFIYGGKRTGAHRWSYEKHVGSAEGKSILHHCDVPSCVNPNHLFAGTQADNMKDKAKKGRCADRHNEKHPLCRITNEQILEMRALRKEGWKQKDLAAKFEVGQDYVSRITNGKGRIL